MARDDELARRMYGDHLRQLKTFDAKLAGILRQAAADAQRVLSRMPDDTVAQRLRIAQYKIAIGNLREIANGIYKTVDSETERQARRAIRLAAEGAVELDAILGAGLPITDRKAFLATSQAAVDALEGKLINDIKLSPKVYRTKALSDGLVERKIQSGILLNKSAAEIAASVRGMIDPRTPGGVSYAARRLGRTEINNAYHTATVRSNAKKPWVTGMKWEVSGSHPRPDECNEYADEDHDDLGAGVYKPDNVPPKPHPQCLCRVTPVTVEPKDFVTQLLAGDFDTYLDSIK